MQDNGHGATEASRAGRGGRLWPKAVVFFGIVALWYGLSLILPLEAWLLNVLRWVEDLGVWGPVLFMLLYLPVCVLMFPDLVPNAAAGAIWGVVLGTVAVSIGRMLGSAATFLLVRRIARQWLTRRLAPDARFHAVSEAVGREGFRIVTLLRLCPVFPVILLNYALGLTEVRLGAFMAGTFIGMIPRTLFVAYLGSGARSLAGLPSDGTVASSGSIALYAGGFVASLAVAAILALKARKLIDEATGAQRATSAEAGG